MTRSRKKQRSKQQRSSKKQRSTHQQRTQQQQHSKKLSQAAQVLPIMAIFLGLSVGVLMIVGALGDRAARIAQADAVADATALAAVAGGETEATKVARANGYELLSLSWEAIASNSPDSTRSSQTFPLQSSRESSSKSNPPQTPASQVFSYCRVEAKVRETALPANRGSSLVESIFSHPLISSSASAASNRPCPTKSPLS